MPDNSIATDIVHASWCEVFPARIAENLQLTLGLIPEGAQLLAVLKGDAYGHGIDRVVPIICKLGFGTSALRLTRKHGLFVLLGLRGL